MKHQVFEGFDAQVRTLLEAARTSLGAIEMHVRETQEDPRLMEASRVYARFCMHVRDYLTGAHAGRPFPRRLAQRVRDLAADLRPCEVALSGIGAGPSVADLEALATAAEALPGAA